MEEMPCCAHRPPEQSSSVPKDEKPMNCPHCQQAMTLDQTPAQNLSPSFHAWAFFSPSPLVTSIHINPPALMPRIFTDSPLPMPARQLLRLHCALLI
jgi:hypothetical protein